MNKTPCITYLKNKVSGFLFISAVELQTGRQRGEEKQRKRGLPFTGALPRGLEMDSGRLQHKWQEPNYLSHHF